MSEYEILNDVLNVVVPFAVGFIGVHVWGLIKK